MKKILTLEETAKMMLSKDYKERFKAEYYQLVNRYKKLKSMLEKWDAGTLGFNPNCSRGICQSQIEAMEKYINVLEVRAFAERIDLLPDEDGLIETIAEAVHNAWLEEKRNRELLTTLTCFLISLWQRILRNMTEQRQRQLLSS